jgi:hypothetical protein
MTKELLIEEIGWGKIKDRVEEVNPHLAKLIDAIKPSKNHTFVKATYPFGIKILEKNGLNLPTTQGVISLNDSQLSKSIKKLIDYCMVPITLVLSKGVEAYQETENRVMPTKILTAGSLMGLWEVFDSPEDNAQKLVWTLFSGARTLFMIPSIADRISHSRLHQKYLVNPHPPKNLSQQIKTFIDIGKNDKNWNCEILFFSKEWTKILSSNKPRELMLANFFLKTAWDQSLNCRNLMDYNFAWEKFVTRIHNLKWKANNYLINTVKHIMLIANGIFPGFVPAINDEVAPIKEIQEAYLETYMFSDFAPIIMRPQYISKKQPVYYSLNFPTLLEWIESPKFSTGIFLVRQLKELCLLLEQTLNGLNFKLDFYHYSEDISAGIKSSDLIVEGDKYLQEALAKFKGLGISPNSKFFKGCIRISLT